MDLYCPVCGEPWDADELHEVAGARYGEPFYVETRPWEPKKRNPDYDSEAYQRFYAEVKAEFRQSGCVALGGRHSERANEDRAQIAALAYELSGDDMDGAAADLDDWGVGR